MESTLFDWIKKLQDPNPEIGGLPICPFAKKAMSDNKVLIKLSDFVDYPEMHILISELKKDKDIILYVYTGVLNYEYLKSSCDRLKSDNPDFVFLLGHPDRPFFLNGIKTTYSHRPIIFIQRKDHINKAKAELEKTTYYSFWTEDQLNDVVHSRI